MDSMQATSAWSKFPLQEVRTNKIKHHGATLTPLNQYDSANATLVELGLFTSKIDSEAKYIVISNHRTWPLYFNANGSIDSSQGRLGAIDARQVELHFDKTKFDTSFSSIRVTNMRTKIDVVMNVDSIYRIILEPGEGTLLRIAPAVGLDLGRMTDNLYNNGRHIAAIDTGDIETFGIKQFIATYQRNGNIVASLPVETPSGSEKRTVGIPVDSVIDNAGNCYNPSIAYNHHNNTIGLTYRRVFPACDTCITDTTLICYRHASYSSPYNFSAMKVIDTVFSSIIPANYLSIPSIAPRDTAVSLKSGEFWVAYTREDSGVGLCLVDTSGNVLRRRMMWALDPAYAQFVSIATHVPYDTVRLAFEDDYNFNPQIYYTDEFLNGGNVLTVSDIHGKNISTTLNACQNRCPQVGIKPFHKAIPVIESFDLPEEVNIVWEAMNTPVAPTGYVSYQPVNYERYAVVKDRRTDNHEWRSFLVFRAGQFNSGVDPVSQRILVNSQFVTSIPHTITPNSWHDWGRYTWNDLRLGQISIARYGFYIGSDTTESPYSSWSRYHYIEPAQEPAMPNVSFGDVMAQPFLYRHTTLQDDYLYDARIHRYNFPSNPVHKDATTGIINAGALPGDHSSCFRIMQAKIGNIQLTSICCDTTKPVDLHGLIDSANDLSGNTPFDWNDKKGVRSMVFNVSIGDILKYQRSFRVGNYDIGDTSAVSDSLNGSTDFLRARIYLRRAMNDSVIAILDSARLKQSGFIQSPSSADSGKKNIPITFADSVYMTMEMSRGDTTNHFVLARIEMHGDELYESFAPLDTSFKKAAPSTWQPSPGTGEAIMVSVIPNPFHTSATVSIDASEDIPLNVTLFDELGRKVTQLSNGTPNNPHSVFTLNSESLTSGSYYLRVQSGSQVVTRKIQLLK